MARAEFNPLEYLARVFQLDDFEKYCIETVFEKSESTKEELIQGFGSEEDAAGYFWSESTMMRYFFLQRKKEDKLFLVLDDRMLVFLQGNVNGYAPFDFLWERVDPMEEADSLLGKGPVSVMEDFYENAPLQKPVWFHLYGKKGIGRKSRILEFCRNKNRSLLIVDAGILAEENQELLGDALRECRIYRAWLLIENLQDDCFIQSLHRKKLIEWMGMEAGVMFTCGEKNLHPGNYAEKFSFLETELPMPAYEESCRLWEYMLRNCAGEEIRAEEWAGKFVFTPGQIKEAISQAMQYALRDGRKLLNRNDLQKGCYYFLSDGMGKKAVKIPAGFTWEELILPAYQKQKLRDACNQAALQKWLYEKWGFGKKITYGRGISIVFAGPPGTGKTMAAQIMASELCLDLYRVELPAVVSKFIGETEKNLEEIFEQAKKSQVILFFDEADVLFSKRTEVRDSNDKYSNMEAAFLLQKMEEYEGITVLATNFLQNFDEAFKRRMKFIIDFPFPEENQRLQLWRQAFPKEMPLKEEPDYEFLAAAFELSGSNIKNVVLHAAFLAAAEGESVTMRHLIAGIRNEYAKSGKTLGKSQLGQYYMLLDNVD